MVRKFLVVVDDRAVTQSAIDQTIEMAQVQRADIFFFCVLPNFVFPAGDMLPVVDMAARDFQTKAANEASQLLSAASAWAERCGVHSHRATSTAPNASQAVAEAAAKRHCDLIVVGAEEQNAVVRLLNGSIIPGLISKATVPVLVCKERPLRTKHSGQVSSPSAFYPPIREMGTRNSDEPND